MERTNQQAYDRGISIFSPDGRLYQVEYAREAVKRGNACVGVRTANGVVFVANRGCRSPLIEKSSIEKIHAVEDNIATASAGHVADARKLVDIARRKAQENRFLYGEPINIETLTKQLTAHIQEHTQTGGARPYGVALLVGGVEDGTPQLFEIDPSGTAYGWRATAVGNGMDEARAILAETYDEPHDLDGGITVALETVARITDDIEPDSVEIVTVDGSSIRTIPDGTVESRVAELAQSDDVDR